MKRVEDADYQTAEESNSEESRDNNRTFGKMDYQIDKKKYFF